MLISPNQLLKNSELVNGIVPKEKKKASCLKATLKYEAQHCFL